MQRLRSATDGMPWARELPAPRMIRSFFLGISTPYNPTATLECVAQNCPRRITILRSPATRGTAFDVLINLCVRSVCFRSVAVGLKVYHRSRTVEWETPQALFDRLHAEFGFMLDVCATPDNAKCARYYTEADDGLSQSWVGVCWCNPPYGKTLPIWIAKAWTSAQAGA